MITTGNSPSTLGGQAVWHGREMESDSRWQFEWTAAEIDDLLAAAGNALNQDIPLAQLDKDSFPLACASAKLAVIRDELEHGCGVARIRGLPIDDLEAELVNTLWMGVCSHLGQPVYQDPSGQLLRRIQDEGAVVGSRYGQLDDDRRGQRFLSSRARTASTGPLRFHTDRTDVVALLCTGLPARGGTSRLASSVAVHDQMLARRPDLAALLYEPIWRSRLGEEEGGESQAYPLPVFGVHQGKFTSHYSRTYVEAAQLNPEVPPMTDAQWEALDLLAELAEELCMTSQFQSGDMQLLNNHVTYHARDAFEDDPPSGKVRSLLRVWLCTAPNHRSLPADHRVLWGATEAGVLRGGIRLTG